MSAEEAAAEDIKAEEATKEQAPAKEAKEVEFQEDEHDDRDPAELLLLDLDGFEGPIDLLLNLARDQKVDLSTISILQLAEQYISFIEAARELRLEIAADYLVMAAWLAYLKSRLLLPAQECEEEPSGEELAEALQYQLRRLQAMQDVAEKLMGLPQKGVHFFERGKPESIQTIEKPIHEVTLYELLKAYGDYQRRQVDPTYEIKVAEVMSVEEALERLAEMLGKLPGEWKSIKDFVPQDLTDALVKRSAIASTFGATLEMAKRGFIEIRQDGLFGDIYVRGREPEPDAEMPRVSSAQ